MNTEVGHWPSLMVLLCPGHPSHVQVEAFADVIVKAASASSVILRPRVSYLSYKYNFKGGGFESQ